MALALGGVFSAVLTQRAGLMLFGTNAHGVVGTTAAPHQSSTPQQLGGVGPVQGDPVARLGGGGSALRLAGGAHALLEVEGAHALLEVEGAVGGEVGGAVGGAGAGARRHPFAHEALLMVAAGHSHACALTDGGVLWAWGNNEHGQLGLGHNEPANAPRRWRGGAAVAMVACAAMRTLVLTADGAVWACGEGDPEQNGSASGDDVWTPTAVPGLQGIVMVAAGQRHSVALAGDGAVWTWGGGFDGLGGALPAKQPADAFGGGAVKFVAAGHDCCAAVTAQGGLWVWGDGADGRLGLGDVQPRTAPTLVRGAQQSAWRDSQVATVSFGAQHAIAATVDGAVWTWGDGSNYQLGRSDDRGARLLPTQIPRSAFGGARMVLASAGMYRSMAATREGILYVWGHGHLGLANRDWSRVPTPLAASLSPGLRVGRSCGPSRLQISAFCLGTLPRLGVAERNFAYRSLTNDLLAKIVMYSRALTEPHKRMHEGLLRLLAVRERED